MSTASQPFQSAISQDEIRSFLVTKPLVGHLYQKVCTYFGSSLHVFRQEPGVGTSGVSFGQSSKPADILLRICTDSGNVAAGIAHELLHLKMAMDSFPVRIATNEFTIGPKIFENIVRINNTVQHAIFHDEFISLGFRTEEFVADWEINGNPTEWKLAAQEHLRKGEPRVRGAWITCYFIETVSRHFGWPNQADQVFKIGRELFPSRMDIDAQWLTHWFARGEFRNSYQYLSAVNALLNRFEFPNAEMERLHRSASGLEFVSAN